MVCPSLRSTQGAARLSGARRDRSARCAAGPSGSSRSSVPADCAYLAAAREHPAAVVRRQQERDVARLLPTIRHLTERQHQLFFLFQTVITRHRPEDSRGWSTTTCGGGRGARRDARNRGTRRHLRARTAVTGRRSRYCGAQGAARSDSRAGRDGLRRRGRDRAESRSSRARGRLANADEPRPPIST